MKSDLECWIFKTKRISCGPHPVFTICLAIMESSLGFLILRDKLYSRCAARLRKLLQQSLLGWCIVKYDKLCHYYYVIIIMTLLLKVAQKQICPFACKTMHFHAYIVIIDCLTLFYLANCIRLPFEHWPGRVLFTRHAWVILSKW